VEGRSIQNPIYKMLYIVIKAKGAVDWINGAPLDVTHGKSYSIQSHHIFPASKLWGIEKYNENNHLHKKIINEIANRAFLTLDSNVSKISNKLPEEYLPEVIKKYKKKALERQLVPLNEALWKIENYEDFLMKRRSLIAQGINKYIEQFVAEEKEKKEVSLGESISMGESLVQEFKSSIRWDLHRNEINKDLEKVIVKTIAGFLNSEGGKLIIGVSDVGEILGIENDIKTLKKKNTDGVQQLLISLINDYLGPEYNSYIKINFEKIKDKYVSEVNVENSPGPIFVKGDNNKKEFYIRAGNSTKLLDSEETHNYIQIHWQ